MSRDPPRSCTVHGKQLGLAMAPEAGAGSVPVTALTEVQLCELAQNGDRAAWGELVTRHDHRVVLSLLARGIRIHEARELAQQAWTRLIAQQRAGRLARLELPGLAIRQAAFLALDAARGRRQAQAGAEDEPADDICDPAASVEERLIRREELQAVQAELARCSPTARRVFAVLYANPGMPHADAARELGLSVQRVRQILCEVRARLRAALETEVR
jgi:RNA polymerase sigma factor (sigma-70 family)